MILLSFSSVAKYMLGLMLAMLGFIPYEALESNSKIENFPSKDTTQFEQLQIIGEEDTLGKLYEIEVFEIKNPDWSEAINFDRMDSINYFVIIQNKDTIAFPNEFLFLQNE